MGEVDKSIEAGVLSADKNSATVKLGEKEFKIFRLKAGKFYEALKVYMNMIQELSPSTPAPEGKEDDVNIDFNKVIVSMFETWPEKEVKFISVCFTSAETEEDRLLPEKILEIAYPEQITAAFRTCLALNRVGENLKNFAAPMGEMGATINPAQVSDQTPQK